MERTEVEELCEELESLAKQGPGENPDGLRRVRGIVVKLQHAADDPYVSEKAHTVVHDFERWFSPRKWQRDGDGGSRLRMLLYQSIYKLRGAMATLDARRSAAKL